MRKERLIGAALALAILTWAGCDGVSRKTVYRVVRRDLGSPMPAAAQAQAEDREADQPKPCPGGCKAPLRCNTKTGKCEGQAAAVLPNPGPQSGQEFLLIDYGDTNPGQDDGQLTKDPPQD